MKKWSLNRKIAFVIAIFVVASVTISTLGISKLAEINDALNYIVSGNANRVARAQELKSLFLLQNITEKNYILEESKDQMTEMKDRMEEREKEIVKKWNELYEIATDGGKKDLETFKVAHDEWWKITKEVMALSFSGENKAAFALSYGKGREARMKGEEAIDSIVERNQKAMNEEAERTDVVYANARALLISVSAIAILAGLILATLILRAVSRAIDNVISNLTDNSNQVTSAAQQIASSSEELSQAASEQASSLEETASSIEEMSSMVQKNAENAKRTSDLAGSSKSSASRGQTVMQEMVKAIDEINSSNAEIMQSIEHSNQKISEIVQVISEIGNKTKVINDIVFQTKLLSFNASVEAARAGEHGKGFAVVAEEVGNLAQMSGNAAKEISLMLEGSIQKVEGIVEETKQKVAHLIVSGKEKVEAGTRIAKECSVVLDEIVENVSNVTQMANEISTASQEQAQGVQEITKAMSQLDQVTQTNAATSEEAASAAEELSAQADALRGVVAVLVETIRGAGEKVAMNREAPKANASKPADTKKSAKVIPLKSAASPVTLKKAAGMESSTIPSENDPRFEEI